MTVDQTQIKCAAHAHARARAPNHGARTRARRARRCVLPAMRPKGDGQNVAVTVTAYAAIQEDEFDASATNCISEDARKFTCATHAHARARARA